MPTCLSADNDVGRTAQTRWPSGSSSGDPGVDAQGLGDDGIIDKPPRQSVHVETTRRH